MVSPSLSPQPDERSEMLSQDSNGDTVRKLTYSPTTPVRTIVPIHYLVSPAQVNYGAMRNIGTGRADQPLLLLYWI
jgi:hypothetical protein